MPIHPSKPRVQAPRDARAAMRRGALPLAWLAGALAVGLAGFADDPYLRYARQVPPPHAYPSAMVAGLVAAMAAQAGMLQAILRPASYRRSWGRALAAWAWALAGLYATLMGSIHAPPPLFACLWWLIAVAAALTGLAGWSAARAFRARDRAG